MKQLHKKLAVMLLIFTLTVPLSCKKYDDGPWFSIYSKKERATGNWRFNRVREDGVDKTEEYATQSVNMLGNGDLYWAQGTYPNSWETYGIGGEWRFASNKEKIEMHFFSGVNNEFKLVWEIKRLAYGDMRLERHEGEKKIEWRLYTPY